VHEFHRLAHRQRLEPSQFLPRTLYRYAVDIDGALNMSSAAVRELIGVDEPSIQADDLSVPQAIGEAAFAAGRTAITAPSAAGPGEALAVFPARLGTGSTVADEQVEIWETVPALDA
jgi:RES domain-containing protein